MADNDRTLDDQALDTLFRSARTHTAWQPRDVPDPLLLAIYDLMKMGPTSANGCPARFVFVRDKAAKERLKPCLDENNREKTMQAPVTVLIANDLKFYEAMPRLYPQANAKAWYEGKPDFARETAFRNATLQGAYFIMAARALGLDCGPMSGFDGKAVKAEFFPDADVEVNFLCNIGYGDASRLKPRNPRYGFNEVCKII